MLPVTPLYARNKELLTLLSSLLDDEREALSQVNADKIIALSDEKSTVIEELNTLNEKRLSLLIKFGIFTKEEAHTQGQFRKWLLSQENNEDLLALVNECDQLLGICKEKNELNEQILTIAQQRNKSLLEILQGTSRKSRVYTAKGNSKPISSKHTIGRA